jgi:hypothetical protein
MADIVYVLNVLQLFICMLIFILAIIYTGTILCVRHFHHSNNFLTVNLCLAAICCSTYWIFFYIMLNFFTEFFGDDSICPYISYCEMMCTLQVPLATVVVSVHRLFSIVYHTKAFFKTKKCIVICVACQWLAGILAPILRIPFVRPVRTIVD